MKIILIFPFNVLAHYLRCLVLAEKYDKTVYKVLFLHSPQYDQYITARGFETFSCAQFDAELVMACAKKFDFSWLNEADLERILLVQVAVIKQFNAHLVIGDVSPSLKMAAELTGIPYISLVNGYMTKYYAHTRGLSRTHRTYKVLKYLPQGLLNGVTALAEKIVFRQVHGPFKTLRKKYDLKPLSNYLDEMEGDKNMICDDENVFPQKHLPVSYQFIGPLIYKKEQNEDIWLSRLYGHKPIILVCMGSTGDWTKLQFLNNRYYEKYTVITAGDTERILAAPHIIAKDFINLNQVLKSAHLMICHGGNGTIYNGFQNGVYMLCLSSHFEQEWNIQAIERKGYGKSANDFNPQRWKMEIQRAVSIPPYTKIGGA